MTIEEIKNEVAMRYCRVANMPKHSNWAEFHYDYATNDLYETIEEAINEAITLYHKRLLEEAGRGLPDEQAWRKWVDKFKGIHGEIPNALEAFEWMRSQASLHLASQKEEIERLREYEFMYKQLQK